MKNDLDNETPTPQDQPHEQTDLSLGEIREIMQTPSPCQIIPRLEQVNESEDQEVFGFLTEHERRKFNEETGHVFNK